MDFLFGFAVLIAAGAWLGRRAAARRREQRLPGRQPNNPIPVEDFADIDQSARAEECSCGGHFANLGEGPVSGLRAMRMVRLECRDCGRERLLYFDVSATVFQ